jgi:hypothetical protein
MLPLNVAVIHAYKAHDVISGFFGLEALTAAS